MTRAANALFAALMVAPVLVGQEPADSKPGVALGKLETMMALQQSVQRAIARVAPSITI